MAQTCAWVLEQTAADITRKNEETLRWVHQQQGQGPSRLQTETFQRNGIDSPSHPVEFIEVFTVELGDLRLTQETWRAAERWQREAERVVAEEMRRLRAARLATERCKLAYERKKAEDEARERRRRGRESERMKMRNDGADRSAWDTYEARWATIASNAGSAETLTFETIPWPVFTAPRSADDIRPGRVAMFILSPVHSQGQSRKERIRAALRRWHPDRFGRLLSRVEEQDKAIVEECAGHVIRCLNNLLERQT
ncbi:uncharacterized protein FIBRA_01898 [Fibroporia radiculosa]|uniref:Uncharacterized protein n=1 Tax=Fibroporia radiculosa TaxID=599839 RepID=J4G187_9APHY|nr:uncharacterized protein FIBRA_01898 [Fibroporia radiculosa]CCL99873.1 predicted protein [Fibroporia radiculosa]